MAWESRGTGTYYYQARRINGRVIKEYVPPLMAEAVALLDAERRAKRKAAADELKAQRAALDALEATLDPLNELADTLTHRVMLTAGYHKHKGQWRRRRV